MKFLLVILAMIVAPYEMYGATNHFIASNVYVVDDAGTYPLYETQRISQRFFDLLSWDDNILKKYKNQFEKIKSINIYVPNDNDKTQTVIINFTNKNRKVIKSNFFRFQPANPKVNTKIFTDEYLSLLSMRYRMVRNDTTDGYVTAVNY